MEPWLFWLIAAIILVIVEIASQWIWTLCFAIGCLAAMVADVAGASLTPQLIVLSAGSLAAFILLGPKITRFHAAHAADKAKLTGTDALIGRQGKLHQPITADTPGRLKIDGDNWQARTADSSPLPQGTLVEVVSLDSIVLIVKAVNR